MSRHQKYITLFSGLGVVLVVMIFLHTVEPKVDNSQVPIEKQKDIIKEKNTEDYQLKRNTKEENSLCKDENCGNKNVVLGRIISHTVVEDTATPEAMTLQISVSNFFQESGYVSSQLCSVYAPLDEDNTAEIEITESCDIFLYRMDGAFRSYTEEQFVEYKAGMEKELYFQFPESESRVGGMGVSIEKVEEGFEIFYVYPDTPADKLGLQKGDIIVEVNGESTYDLHVDDFIQMTTGQAGTQAEFRLYGDNEVDRPRIFTRTPLDL